MKLLALGLPDEVRGLALAGVPVRVLRDGEGLERALGRLRSGQDAGVGLVLLGPGLAALAPRAVLALQGRDGPPAVLVLPARTQGGAHADAR